MVHRVKTHRWNRGILESFEALFESLESAQSFIKHHGHRNAKIYDDSGILIYNVAGEWADTYA